jgi:hypothetical protein
VRDTSWVRRASLKPVMQVLAIAVVAVVLCLPCLLRGIPQGYDSQDHIGYQHHFSRQFWEGEWYPRWLAEANEGYGSPVFIIQYPLPYVFTAALRPLTHFEGADREARELGIFVFVCLLAAGMGTWLWLRQIATSEASTIAAIAYMGCPFVLGEALYVRAAVGELSALACMPFGLACCQAMHKTKGAELMLGVIFAFLILSNLINAVLFIPLLVVYAFSSGRQLDVSLPRSALRVGLAMILGVGLASAYIVPFMAYRGLFNVRQMAAFFPDFELGRYFLFLTWRSLLDRPQLAVMAILIVIFSVITAKCVWNADRPWKIRGPMLFLLLVGWMAMAPNLGPAMIRSSGLSVSSFDGLSFFSQRMLLVVFATTLLGLVAFCTIPRNGREEGLVLMGATGAYFVLMTPASAWIWNAIPALVAVQFPFRLGGVLSLSVAGLVALALDGLLRENGSARRHQVLIIALILLGVVGAAAATLNHSFREPRIAKFDPSRDFDMDFPMYLEPSTLVAFADEMGANLRGFSAASRNGEIKLRSGLSSGEGNIKISREGPRKLLVSADVKTDTRVWIGQTYSPLWRILPADGFSSNLPVRVSVSPRGLIELSVPPGNWSFYLFFDGGIPEALGIVLSGLSVLALVSASLFLASRRLYDWRRGGLLTR